MFRDLFLDPLRNSNFLHAHGVWNHIGMIANAVYHRFFAELFQLFTWKLPALIAAGDIMACGTVKKTVGGTVFAAVTNMIRKTAVANIRERRTRPAKQAAYGRTFLGGYSVHNELTMIKKQGEQAA